MSASSFALTSPNNEADARARETDGPERGDSPTPRGAWRAIFEAAICYDLEEGPCVGVDPEDSHGARCSGQALLPPFQEDRPLRALSLMAGYGSDASELRAHAMRQGWPIHITGVELCEARDVHLRRWCDEVLIADWRDAVALMGTDGAPVNAHGLRHSSWDIIVTNPDFSHILRSGKVWMAHARGGEGGWVDSPFLPAQRTMVPTLLEHAPAVLMLHREQAFTKSERGREVARDWPAAASWSLGPLSFSKDGKMDSCCYVASVFLRGHEGPTAAYTLRELSAGARRWDGPSRIIPGSEDPSDALPAAPGWSP